MNSLIIKVIFNSLFNYFRLKVIIIIRMIDVVFAAEFDLLKGCVVKQHYPQWFNYDEMILAAYMLPDGV